MDEKEITKVNAITEIILQVAYDYHENWDEFTTSDFQGICMAKAMDILKIIK